MTHGARHGADRNYRVVAINVPARLARLNTGAIVPITTLYDDDGNKTDDGDAAVIFVAGSDTLHAWFNGRVDEYGD